MIVAMSSSLLASTASPKTSLVADYVLRALPAPGPAPGQVRLVQTGEMRMKPDGRALRFDAIEELSVDEVAFSWRASAHVAPLVSMHVVDQYRAGTGLLSARLLGIPVVRARGPEVDVAEAMRYLAELAWVPHAAKLNRNLEWREIEDDVVEVSTPVERKRVAVRLRFDTNGDILAAFATRPRVDGRRIVESRWLALFGEYDELSGIRIPTRAEVRWELADGPFIYWIGRITALDLIGRAA
jgi:Family of unknown function (DUF6544)